MFEQGVQFTSMSGSYPSTNINISAKNGLKSLKVTIVGGNSGFQAVIDDELHLVDYELVGESGKKLETLLNFMQVPITMPKEGCTEYTFEIGQFYSMMDIYGPTVNDKYGNDYHEFKVTAEDNNGNIVGPLSLKVTIN